MIKTFPDDRGFLSILQCKDYDQVFVASNNWQYTFRGMHYQTNPNQTKTVKIIQGQVIDFLYHLETGEVKYFTLDKNSEPLVIGPEYAHGYLTTHLNTIMLYAVNGEFNSKTYKSIPYHTIPVIKDIVNEKAAHAVLKISDKDNIGQ